MYLFLDLCALLVEFILMMLITLVTQLLLEQMDITHTQILGSTIMKLIVRTGLNFGFTEEHAGMTYLEKSYVG
jgi:hypothetical protein